LIVISPYYKNGTNDGTDVGKNGFFSRRNETNQAKTDANQAHMLARMEAETDVRLKKMK
jgi:hypothetical protein